MSQVSLEQIAQAAYNAGFRGLDLIRATAITIPESGSDPTRIQQGQPMHLTGWGAWQITPGNAALLDLQANANAAFEKYQRSGNTFQPWSVWPNHVTADMLAKAGVAAAQIKGQAPVSSRATITANPMDALGYALTTALNPVTMLNDAAKQFGVSGGDLVIDVGMVATGLALLFIGVYEGFKVSK